MHRHFLIPTDGSRTAAHSVRAGIALAKEFGAKVTFFTAMPRYRVDDDEAPITVEEHQRRTAARAEALLAEPAGVAQAAGIDYDSLSLENDRPYQAIIDAAELKHCDLIVIGSHGRRGLAGLLYGSETRKVLTHSSIPALVFRT